MTSDPTTGEADGYWSSNDQLRTTSGPSAVLSYDALDRLAIVDTNSADTKFAWDGAGAIAEYDGAGTLQRRYVFDPATGRPLIWYEGTGTGATARRYLSADERGSVISVSDSAGASLAINSYDEYGMPSFGALADQRFGYTGQMWLSQAGLHQYLFRAYGQHLGRFAQTDPIGYGSGPNLYAYVGGDPVNWVDPLGLSTCEDSPNPDLATDGSGGGESCDVIVTGIRLPGIGIGGAVRPPPPPSTGGPAKPKPQPKPKPKPEKKTPEQCAAEQQNREKAAIQGAAISTAFSIAALDYPWIAGAAVSAARGARIGALLGEFGGPLPFVIGAGLGALTGVGIYAFNSDQDSC